MVTSRFTTATLTYMVNGKKQSKKVSIPTRRYGLGISKQGSDYVEIGWFKESTRVVAAHVPGNYQSKYVDIPRNAGLATLWIGKRAISKAT